jgi:hypothetical protein
MAVDRVEAVRRLLLELGATTSERTITEILRALYVQAAVDENHLAEVRGTSLAGEPTTVVVSAREVRDAICGFC